MTNDVAATQLSQTSIDDKFEDDFSTTLSKVKKAKRKADILTVAEEIMIDGNSGYRCTICVYELLLLYLTSNSLTYFSELRAQRHASGDDLYKNIKTDFRGNITTIRKHISRCYDDHFIKYSQACKEKNLTVHTMYLFVTDQAYYERLENPNISVEQTTTYVSSLLQL